jgi:hypothetical protein
MRVSSVQGVRFTSSVRHLTLAVFVLGPQRRHNNTRLASLGGLGAKISVEQVRVWWKREKKSFGARKY